MHGINKGPIRLTQIPNWTEKSPNKHHQILGKRAIIDIHRNYNTIDNGKTGKTDGINTIQYRSLKPMSDIKSRIKHNLAIHLNDPISKTVETRIASSKENESESKNVWLSPAPPVYTPDSHNNDEIRHLKQTWSSHCNIYNLFYRSISLTKSRIFLDDKDLKADLNQLHDTLVHE